MSFQPATYDEAKAAFKPLKRSRLLRGLDTSTEGRKPLSANRIKRKRALKKTSGRSKRETNGKLKKRVWKQFSLHIRTTAADSEGLVQCVTCPAKKPWKEMQAGHFIPGRLNSNLFDERGVHPQCSLCNVVRAGNGPMYYKFMLATYGQEVIDELLEQNNQTRKWLPGELKELLRKYRGLNAENPLAASPVS